MLACSSFHGALLVEWSSPLFHLSETRYDERHRTSRHAHEGATVAFVLAGGFTELQGSRAVECGPASVMFRRGGIEHDDVFERAGGRCFNIEMPSGLVPGSGPTAVHCHAGPASWAAHRILAAAR